MPEKIDEKMVRHIAHLSRLALTEDEVYQFGAQLSSILEYVDKLNELDTESVEPTAHALPVRNVLREDVLRESFDPDRSLGNAPQRDGNFFKVPKVLDQDSA